MVVNRGAERSTKAAAPEHPATSIARAFGGALVFSLPVFMTMEMWELGFYMDRARLILLVLLNIPILVFLSHYSGFEATFDWRDDLRDAAIAYGVGIISSATVLSIFGLLAPGMSVGEIAGKVALQSVPASIGALLARTQLGGRHRRREREDRYGGELMLMAAGALFLSLNVAPTEEMILISYKMSPVQGIALVLGSIIVMHGFVFAAAFKGGSELSPHTPWWSAFMRFTMVGYVIALLISAFALWTFGRMDGQGVSTLLMAMIVLGFPAALGAAAARLIL
nr:TIGR02587 family membrane protein [Arsenicitalea aurantiaca]